MSAPAGWYPQPDGRQRWWDGTQWTEHYHDATAPAADAAASSEAGAATDTTAGAATGADHPYGQTAYVHTATPSGWPPRWSREHQSVSAG